MGEAINEAKVLKKLALRKRLLACKETDVVNLQELPPWCFGDNKEILEGLGWRRQAEIDLFSDKGGI